ncbi:hypothetical protein CRM22_009883 [Opisthorchis felineus]|uniref:Galactokinase n=2 Tax=Opisthorchis felineus TaxID=147828 RepID=A0A4S2L4F2_OPIFE|nr:hypothetical protein CRM22_009883 [Opisthorchis felineus]
MLRTALIMSANEDDQPPVYPLNELGTQLAEQMNARGLKCQFVVCAPGRVNLIGEHIDYNGYAVLPMALEQAVHLAVATSPTKSVILSSSDTNYESATVSIEEALTFGSDGPPVAVQWFHYPLCAYHGIADYVKQNSMKWEPPSLALHVGGAEFGGLWPAAGLSSSSALVVASAIAIAHAAGLRISRRELAGLCAQCERYVGMQGGGMDQAASLLGCEDNAILIEFTKPLVTVRPVPLPSDVVFVVAHSGVHARKAATSMYNERVSECRLAAKILTLNSPKPTLLVDNKPLCLVDAQRAWGMARPGDMVRSTSGSTSIVKRFLKPGITDRSELSSVPLSAEDIDSCLTPRTKNMSEFRLQERAEHVYAEAERALAFYDLCNPLKPAGDVENAQVITQKLGELMNESQRSCAQLYDCSCPALDELISICRSAGAIGSRLTGAGWGGCTVSIVPKAIVSEFINRVRTEYYMKKGMDEEAAKLIFVSKPGRAAGYMVVN